MNQPGATIAGGQAPRPNDAVTVTSANTSSDASAAATAAAGAATPTSGGGTSGIPTGVGGDWRDKDADRSARQQIARIMYVTCAFDH